MLTMLATAAVQVVQAGGFGNSQTPFSPTLLLDILDPHRTEHFDLAKQLCDLIDINNYSYQVNKEIHTVSPFPSSTKIISLGS